MPEQNAEPQQTMTEAAPANGAGIEVKPRHESAAKNNGTVDANYQYWRDNGAEWAEGYDHRKKTQVLYHIQELMLTHYMQQHAATAPQRPLKVLEFGCGPGRHLRNLTRLPDVDAYGFDQSAAMASGVLRWSGKAWFDSHISVGMPTGRLPYDDQSFDIVYTAEVLVHVRPEHLDGILSELIRVCRGHILHIETSEHIPLVSDSHNGCWRHDLAAAYARLGRECQVLPSGYAAHTPYRVKVLQEPRFTWAPAIIEMYRRMERDINAGFDGAAIEAYNQRAAMQQQISDLGMLLGQRAHELETARAGIAAYHAQSTASTARAEALAGDLESFKGAELAQRSKAEQLERVNADLQREIAALTARAAELEKLWEADRTTAQALDRQRRTFVESVSKHIRP